jgi:hypothetical protein
MSRAEAIAMFTHDAAAFLVKHPQCAPFHRPCWVERDVPADQTAPWGCEWYEVEADGRLRMHSFEYDSTG